MSGFAAVLGAGLTVLASLALIGFAIAASVLEKFAALKWARMLVLPCIMSGVAGLAAVSVFGFSFAGLTSSGMKNGSKAIGSIAPAFAYAVPIIVALVVLVLFVHDTWAVKLGRRGTFAAVALPVTLGFIPGSFGLWAVAIVGVLPLALGAIVTKLLGG